MKKYDKKTEESRFVLFKSIRLRIGNSGFTLIELLVTIAIIVMLSSILFVGQAKEEKKVSLQRTAYGLAQEFRLAQEKALGAEKATCSSPTDKPCGFGLYFLPNSGLYSIFIDCANNCKVSDYRRAAGEDIGTIKLEKDIDICSVEFDAVATSSLDIVFSPPDPIVYVQGIKNKWGHEGIITFCLKSDVSEKKKVKINTAGRIEIE